VADLVRGKAALVTGGASGIGRATARLLAREGARVLVCDRDAAGAEKTAAKIAAGGGEAAFRETDVCREEDVCAAVHAAVEAFGRLDCAVNNAGLTGDIGPLHETSLEGWHGILAVNLTGVFLCLKHEIPVMQAQGGGAIVNLSSGAGVVGTPGLAPYAASKHGVLGLTKTAALENATTGVRVNAVCPGSTDTPLLRGAMAANAALEKLVLRGQPGGRLGRPEEIAEACVWLCSDRASFVTGESLLVDGGAVAR